MHERCLHANGILVCTAIRLPLEVINSSVYKCCASLVPMTFRWGNCNRRTYTVSDAITTTVNRSLEVGRHMPSICTCGSTASTLFAILTERVYLWNHKLCTVPLRSEHEDGNVVHLTTNKLNMNVIWRNYPQTMFIMWIAGKCTIPTQWKMCLRCKVAASGASQTAPKEGGTGVRGIWKMHREFCWLRMVWQEINWTRESEQCGLCRLGAFSAFRCNLL